MNLNDVKKASLSRKRKKRVGRGQSSGHGSTAGRGMKGQKHRTGNSIPFIFEGGTTPLIRKLPKRGFNNALFQNDWVIANIEDLNSLKDGQVVTLEELDNAGIVNARKSKEYLKILGNGELTAKKLHVKAHKISESAKKKIEDAQGKVEIIEFKTKPRNKKKPARSKS